MEDKILVSIVVISYNAEDYIEDLLDSIKNQTYENLELIVSDDCSSDETITKVEKWLEQNDSRFDRYQVLKSPENTGVTANVNRGLLATNGKYIKMIASDDLLLETAIEDLLNHCIKKELEFCYSKAIPFNDNGKYITKVIENEESNYNHFFNLNQHQQYKSLLRLTIPRGMVIGGFHSKNILERLNYFDEKYPMMEDYPFLIKMSKKGYKFELLNKYTCKYRVRNLENLESSYKRSKRYTLGYNNLKDFRNDVIIKELIRERMLFSFVYLKLTMLLLDLEYKGKSNFITKTVKHARAIKQRMIDIK